MLFSEQHRQYESSLREDRRRAYVRVLASAFSPDGKYLVAGTSEGRICIWKLSAVGDHAEIHHPTAAFHAHTGATYSVCFANDGATLVSGGDDGVRTWDWGTIAGLQGGNIQPRGVLDTPRVEERGVVLPVPEINSVSILNQRVYGATGDGSAYEWDLATGQCLGRFEGHTGYLHALAARPSASQIVTGSEDGTIKFWDVRSRACTQTLWEPNASNAPDPERWVSCLAVDDSDSWLVAGGGGRALVTWHMPSGTCAAVMPTASSPQVVEFNHSGEVVMGGNEPWIYTWATSGALLCRAASSNSSVFTVASDRVNKLVACGGTGGTMDVYVTPTSRSFTLSCF